MNTTLYEADRTHTQYNNAPWNFHPVPFERLAWLLDLMLHGEIESERETRITALLSGEVICTNFSAYRLVRTE